MILLRNAKIFDGENLGKACEDLLLKDGVVVRRGGFGGPMQIRIRAYDLLLRKEEAANIEVDILEYGCGERRLRRGRGHMRSCDRSAENLSDID